MLNTSTEHILANLNGPQHDAVVHGDGPLLIFAGAGSGKTRVLTHRIAHLILVHGVSPEQILAVTFTNKAANEMKERIGRLVGRRVGAMWVGTFHAVCARILRRDGELVGVPQNFVIFDTDDQLTVVKDCYTDLNIDPGRFKPTTALNRISNAKNELMTPADYESTAYAPDEKLTARIYTRYQERLEENGGLDFDDLIMKTVELLKHHPQVTQEYQERFRYLFVDEYQDINRAQYEFVSMLAQRYRNLCVVGDDDQSIYAWRGADSRLLLQFEKDYPEARVIKLEQNYRSPQTILDAAYHVIKKIPRRKDKRLWTEREGGPQIKCYQGNDEHGEAAYISRVIRDLVRLENLRYSDIAILYRVNAQSRVLEQMMLSQGIPYRIVGGLKFFARKEIKDIIAYLRVLYNPDDTVSLRRIINVPARDIGAKTISDLESAAAERGISLYQAVLSVEHINLAARAKSAVRQFATLMNRLMTHAHEMSIVDLIRAVIEESGYEGMLREEGTVQSRTRLENVYELISAAQEFESQAEDEESRSLRAFLEQISLVADLEESAGGEGEEAVTLMTLHAAKGLEFPVVFMCGMEETIFPMARAAMSGDPSDMEEERRLCYVGITRAQQQLYFTLATSRTLYGSTSYNKASCFLSDIPEHLLQSVEGSWGRPGPKQWTWEDADATVSPAAQAIVTGVTKEMTAGFRAGDRVRHHTFGEGIVLATSGSGDHLKVTVNFPRLGTKTLMLSYAPLEKL